MSDFNCYQEGENLNTDKMTIPHFNDRKSPLAVMAYVRTECRLFYVRMTTLNSLQGMLEIQT